MFDYLRYTLAGIIEGTILIPEWRFMVLVEYLWATRGITPTQYVFLHDHDLILEYKDEKILAMRLDKEGYIDVIVVDDEPDETSEE